MAAKGTLLFRTFCVRGDWIGKWQTRLMSSTPSYKYAALQVTSPSKHVYQVTINRPDKRNSLDKELWRDIKDCFQTLGNDSTCRSIVLSGAGRGFCSGIDVTSFGDIVPTAGEEIGRKAFFVQKIIAQYQESFTAIEKCPKPVVAAVHGFCIGAGIDMIASSDIRYCTSDAYFSIKEVDIGLAADVGTLQRMPKTIGNDSVMRELAFTGRRFQADEAQRIGFVGRVFPDHESMLTAALELAQMIASKSPIAVQGTKINLNYSRDHSVDEALHFITHWNMAMLQSEDLMKSAMAAMDKSGKLPEFKDL